MKRVQCNFDTIGRIVCRVWDLFCNRSHALSHDARPSPGSAAELGAPTSVDLVSSDPAYMVASFSSGHMGLFNMETQQLVLKLESAGAPGTSRFGGVARAAAALQTFACWGGGH